MLDKLIPWKRNEGELKVEHDNNPLTRFRQEFDDLWDRFWSDSNLMSSGVDMDDNDKEYVVRAELPGFSPAEIDVKVSGNVLTLSAEHNEEKSEENGRYRRSGSFHRSFTLPQGVLTEKIDADYHNGVLELHLPKSEESKPKRIAVKAK
jgi:HSP20 family protein